MTVVHHTNGMKVVHHTNGNRLLDQIAAEQRAGQQAQAHAQRVAATQAEARAASASEPEPEVAERAEKDRLVEYRHASPQVDLADQSPVAEAELVVAEVEPVEIEPEPEVAAETVAAPESAA